MLHSRFIADAERTKKMLALITSAMLVATPVSAATQTSSGSNLMRQLLDRVEDKGFVLHMTVHCSPGSVGIMSYDKTDGMFLAANMKSYGTFSRAWAATCRLET